MKKPMCECYKNNRWDHEEDGYHIIGVECDIEYILQYGENIRDRQVSISYADQHENNFCPICGMRYIIV